MAARRAHNPEVGGSNPPPASTYPPARGSQLVLKAEAEACTAPPDATDREPRALPLIGRTVTVSMTGEVAVVAECGTVILFDGAMAKQLVAFCAGRAA